MINIAKKMLMLWFMLLLYWPATGTEAATNSNNVKPGCVEKCGDITVPYPFGIDDSNCAMNKHFLLNCSRSDSPPKLMLEDIVVLNISIEDGSMIASLYAAESCYDGQTGSWLNGTVIYINFGDGPFRLSNTRNKLTAFGCDTKAYMSDAGASFLSGCLSVCLNKAIPVNITENSCSGFGCCEIPLPKNLKKLMIEMGSASNHSEIGDFMPCDYAFLADETFDLSDLRFYDYGPHHIPTSNVTIEWVVKEEECPVSDNSICGSDTNCTYSENGQGYRCLCRPGFQGNPYLGCHDIDECKEGYPCEGTCKNTVGGYTCDCPIGMRGDGKVGCRGFRISTIVSVIGAAVFTVIIGILSFIAYSKQRKERNFLKNGGVILKHQRVRIFSEAEIVKATKNYDNSHFLGEGSFGSAYKGVLHDNTQVAVKKPKETDKIQMNKELQHKMSIVSKINHQNVVKILGLCLQTEVPLLVYEFVSNGSLFHHIHDTSSQVLRTWKNRLRIAAETASALDYLYSLASPPIIYGNVKSANILLDHKFTAKVADFGASVLISPNETAMVTKTQETLGYLDPEYLLTGNLTEKSDVYSFGVVLVELLTGMKPSSHVELASNEKITIIQYFLSSIENNSLRQILSFQVADESEMEEKEFVAELASKCLRSSGIKRPKMKQVSEELGRVKKLNDNLRAQEKSEETQHLLGDSSNFSFNIQRM